MSIAITQRVETFEAYGEKRDCLDQEWTHLIDAAGLDLLIIPNTLNSIEHWLENKNIEGMILTGGNDLSHLPDAKNSDINRDKTEKEILHWVSKRKIPLLGVCRGMQFMNCFLSGSLSKVKNHSGNSHSIEIFNNKILPIKSLFVNSYHNWAIKRKDLSPSLKAVAIAEDGTIEAVEHHDLPWLGIMWHPERENISQNSNNVKLIKRFFS
jgi:gamma-glutamyl-gamma-aminobutyrate hydrolase PuuD